MTKRFGALLAAAAAALTLAVATAPVYAQAEEKPAKAGKRMKPAALGRVAKIDTAARTFTITRKKGDVVVAWDDRTAFKKRAESAGGKPSDATAADLKDGHFASVFGKDESGKVTATQVIFGERVRKNKNP